MIIEIERNHFPAIDIDHIEQLTGIGILRIHMKNGNVHDVHVTSKEKQEEYIHDWKLMLTAINDRNSVIIGETFSNSMIESFEQSLVPPPLSKNLH